MSRKLIATAALAVFALGFQGMLVLPSQAQGLGDALQLLESMDPSLRESFAEQLDSSGDAASPGNSGGAGTLSPTQYLNVVEREQALERIRERVYRPADTVVVDVSVLTSARPARLVTQGREVPPLEIPAKAAPELSGSEAQELARLVDLIRSQNPYKLNNDGALVLPGFAPIPLSGLSDEQATLRIDSEPGLLKLDMRVTKLPVKRLRTFGYDLFSRPDSPFGQERTNAPVPAGYTLAVGDQLRIQLYGGQNRNLNLTVTRDGVVNFPELGPISVLGKSIDAVSAEIETRVETQMIGVRASVSLGGTRGIQIFVMGEALRPGSFNLADSATVTSALAAAGGISETGSLREIQVKRDGALVGRLDLYDLLLSGDSRADVRLADGDVVFVPPIGATVTVEGEVQRSAIYELRGETSIAEIIRIAGGLTAEADLSRIVWSQLDDAQRRVVSEVSLVDESAAGAQARIGNGDALRVLALRPVVDSAVRVAGHVHRAGVVAWRQGIRLAEVLPSIDELKENADVDYVLIRRERIAERRIEVLSASLAQALMTPSGEDNLQLESRDQVIVLDRGAGRRQLLEPILAELRAQATLQAPTAVVSVNGQVKAPGDYPLEPDMRVSDLIRAGDELRDSAYGATAELVRRKFKDGRWSSELVGINLDAVLRGDRSADISLAPGDSLLIKQAPEWRQGETITLAGEVMFPGTYAIRRGETLRSVIERAGGLTELANPAGSIFTRAELQQLEQREVSRLAERLRRDLASSALQNSQSAALAGAGGAAAALLPLAQQLLGQLENVKPVGRLVIDLDRVLRGSLGSRDDIVLRTGDQLIVPRFRQEVSVIGEVQNVTSHLHRLGFKTKDYIALSGGLRSKADDGRTFVVKPDGTVVLAKQGWFNPLSSGVQIQPGDTIVVPLDTESLSTLGQIQLWQAVTGIIYNSAVAVAAIQGL